VHSCRNRFHKDASVGVIGFHCKEVYSAAVLDEIVTIIQIHSVHCPSVARINVDFELNCVARRSAKHWKLRDTVHGSISPNDTSASPCPKGARLCEISIGKVSCTTCI